MSTSDNAASRWQQSIPATLVVALAVWVSYVSFNVDDPEPYLFPRLVAIALLGLSIFALVRALAGKNATGGGFNFSLLKNILPGMAVMIIFAFFAAEALGFYTASAVAFLAIVVLYDPASHAEIGTWVKRVTTMVGFMAVMYGLFSLLLKVQIPRGLFL